MVSFIDILLHLAQYCSKSWHIVHIAQCNFKYGHMSHIAQYKTICQRMAHIAQYDFACRRMVSIAHPNSICWEMWFILHYVVSYVDMWPLNLARHKNDSLFHMLPCDLYCTMWFHMTIYDLFKFTRHKNDISRPL